MSRRSGQCYCTEVWRREQAGDSTLISRLDEMQCLRRESHAVEANLGVGGGGKTWRNLSDKTS